MLSARRSPALSSRPTSARRPGTEPGSMACQVLHIQLRSLKPELTSSPSHGLLQPSATTRMNTNTGDNVINILCAAFMRADPKRAKKTVKPSVFFVLLGFVHRCKSCSKNVDEIDPCVYFDELKSYKVLITLQFKTKDTQSGFENVFIPLTLLDYTTAWQPTPPRTQ